MLECCCTNTRKTKQYTQPHLESYLIASFRSKFVLLHLLFLHCVCVCVCSCIKVWMRGWSGLRVYIDQKFEFEESPISWFTCYHFLLATNYKDIYAIFYTMRLKAYTKQLNEVKHEEIERKNVSRLLIVTSNNLFELFTQLTP